MAVTQTTFEEAGIENSGSTHQPTDDGKCNIFGCGVPPCDFSTNSLISLHGHYHSYHYPESLGNGTSEEGLTEAMNQYYRRLSNDTKQLKSLSFPF